MRTQADRDVAVMRARGVELVRVDTRGVAVAAVLRQAPGAPVRRHAAVAQIAQHFAVIGVVRARRRAER